VEELGKEDTGKREWDSPLCAALRNGGAGEGGHRAEAVGLASMCPQERTHTNTHKHAFLARTLKQATSAEHDERKGDGRVVGPRGCRAGLRLPPIPVRKFSRAPPLPPSGRARNSEREKPCRW
jgi:hypothetical protein